MKSKNALITVILLILFISLVRNFSLAVAPIDPSTYNPNSSSSSSSISPKTYTGSNDSSEIKSVSSNTIAIIIACVFGFILYIIPMFIALKRKHPQRFPIGCLNIFLGWTFLGWVVCLVWSLSNTKTEVQNTSNKYEDLERLQKLKENGTISEEEFETEKQKILK